MPYTIEEKIEILKELVQKFPENDDMGCLVLMEDGIIKICNLEDAQRFHLDAMCNHFFFYGIHEREYIHDWNCQNDRDFENWANTFDWFDA